MECPFKDCMKRRGVASSRIQSRQPVYLATCMVSLSLSLSLSLCLCVSLPCSLSIHSLYIATVTPSLLFYLCSHSLLPPSSSPLSLHRHSFSPCPILPQHSSYLPPPSLSLSPLPPSLSLSLSPSLLLLLLLLLAPKRKRHTQNEPGIGRQQNM